MVPNVVIEKGTQRFMTVLGTESQFVNRQIQSSKVDFQSIHKEMKKYILDVRIKQSTPCPAQFQHKQNKEISKLRSRREN